VIFEPGLFGPGLVIDKAYYHMASLDGGVKYRGLAVECEYYWRRVNDFKTIDASPLPFDELNDHGFQAQVSYMVLPQTLEAYAGYSKIYGEYGDPHDSRVGLNWYILKNKILRWNFELLNLNHSPTGGLSLISTVGGNGPVYSTTLLAQF
jgi:hypothetical protein